ncbi:MAG: RHS repeat-associated core domain-containing protein [Bacteroidota bacterium]
MNLDLYDYGARMYDSALGRWHTQDRFAEKYLDFSPYQYAANNPILFIDVNGDSLMIFENGVYSTTIDDGEEEITGYNQNYTEDEDGNRTYTGGGHFSYNDLGEDKEALTSGNMTLSFVSDNQITDAIDNSGIYEQNSLSRWSYAANESNRGKMDYYYSEAIKHDYGSLHIIDGVGYNDKDAGNYLWGYAMGKMGFTQQVVRNSSNINAWWSAKTSNPGLASTHNNPIFRFFQNRSWSGDSPADQRAIIKGYHRALGYNPSFR